MLCPNCRERLQPVAPVGLPNPTATGGLTCVNGHRFGYTDGILTLLSQDFAATLASFLPGFSRLRAADGKRIPDPTAYEQLPFGAGMAEHFEWRLRRYDLAIVYQMLQSGVGLKVLDVGAWNGWLSHRLAALGHTVTAVDYFVDESDGLGARKFYSTQWRAIQMDLTDLSVLDEQYDLVVLNRCVQFYADPVGYARHVRDRVAPGGQLIVTGMQFFGDARLKERGVQALRAYLNQNGLDFFKPMKGYLDRDDELGFRDLGLRLQAYPQLWAANLKARFSPTSPRHCYGIASITHHDRLS